MRSEINFNNFDDVILICSYEYLRCLFINVRDKTGVSDHIINKTYCERAATADGVHNLI